MASVPDTEQNDPLTEYIYHPGESFCRTTPSGDFDADIYMDKLMQRRREILANDAALHFLRTARIYSRLRKKAGCGLRKAVRMKQNAKVVLLKTMAQRRLR